MMTKSEGKLLLRGADVVLPDRIIENGVVVIEDNRITRVGSDGEGSLDAETIELRGLSIFPGFIDVHIHGAAGVDVMDATPATMEEVSRFLVSKGVTAWLPTFVPASDASYSSAVSVISQTMNNRGARILGVHYEGPFVNSAQCGALHAEYFKTYSGPHDLDPLHVPENLVHMITLAPEVVGGVELIRELSRRRWVISIGHTRADLETLEKAHAAGAGHMTHFMNAMLPLHHRNPGPISWGLSHDDVTVDIIADGVHLHPSILRMLVKIKGSQRLTLISDAIAATGRGNGSFEIWGETISVKNGRTSNVHGSIAGSVITMLEAVRMMRSLSVSDVEIARMASTNPARLLGIDMECGTIEVGKRADLVAIDANGEVKLTMIGGEVVFRS